MSAYPSMTYESEASENQKQTSYGQQPAYPPPGQQTMYPPPGQQTMYPPPGQQSMYPLPGQQPAYPPPPQYTPATTTVQMPVIGQPTMLQPGQSVPPGANVIYVQAPGQPVDSRVYGVNDLLGFSIFTTLCCNCIFGIIALVFSSRVREAKRHNNYEQAKSAYKVVLAMNIVAVIAGIVTISVVTALIVTSMQTVYVYHY